MKHVYVFDMDNCTVKIGVSSDVERRMSEVQRASGLNVLRHYEVEVASDRKAFRIERDLHLLFADYRTNGEFFTILFEDACDELDKRNPTEKVEIRDPVCSLEDKARETVRLFAKTFCTTDKNEGGVCGGGIPAYCFFDELTNWVNANSDTFVCRKNYYCTTAPAWDLYDRATGEHAFNLWRDMRCDEIGTKLTYIEGCPFLYGLYWKQSTPQELALQQRLKHVCDAFTGLSQQAKGSIIGGFITDRIIDLVYNARLPPDSDWSNLFKQCGMRLEGFARHFEGELAARLRNFCYECFHVYIETPSVMFQKPDKGPWRYELKSFAPPFTSHCRIIVHPAAFELDDEKVGVYYGSFTQILQRYCPLDVFFDSEHEWRVRYNGKRG